MVKEKFSLSVSIMFGDWLGDMWSEEGNSSALANFTDFDNLTCAARSFQTHSKLMFSLNFTATLRIFQTIFYILITGFGLFLNALVVVLVAKYKKLHTRPFAIVLQVVVLNFILSSTILILRPISSIANQWLFGEIFCSLTGYVAIASAIIKAILMFTFAMDRVLTLFSPYSYPKHSFKIMLVLSVAAWVTPMVYFIVGFPGILDCFAFLSEAYMCLYSSACAKSCEIAFAVILAIMFVMGFIVPIVFYSIMCCKARQLSKAPAQAPDAAVPKSDWKATIMFFSLFLVVSFLSLPSRISLGTAFILPDDNQALFAVSSLLLTLSTLSIAVDPIMIMLHKDMREIILGAGSKICRATANPQPEEAPEPPQTQETQF